MSHRSIVRGLNRAFKCVEKRAFPNRAAALAKNQVDRGGGNWKLDAYQCRWCGKWHSTKRLFGKDKEGL